MSMARSNWLLLALAAMVALAANASSADESKAKTDAEKKSAKDLDAFLESFSPYKVKEEDVKVADGSVEELLALMEKSPKIDVNSETFLDDYKRYKITQLKAAELLLRKPDASSEIKEKARKTKFDVLESEMEFEPKQYAERFDAFVAELTRDFPESELTARGQGRKLLQRIRGGDGSIRSRFSATNSEPPIDEEAADVLKELEAFAKKFPKAKYPGYLCIQYSDRVGKGDKQRGIDALEKTMTFFAPNSPSCERIRGIIVNRTIIGKTMELAGPTLSGSEFDVRSLKGKVVLVDFWATWCSPCVAELPNVKAAYEKFHEQGFEVVAISLDDDRAALEDFVAEHKFPWPQIVFSKPEDMGWSNPLSRKYGIMSIPATFLLDKDGIVVDRNLRGKKIEEAVEKLLAPASAPLAN